VRKFRLIPGTQGQKNLALDFTDMIEAEMFYEPRPTFDEIIHCRVWKQKLIKIVEVINDIPQ
jgi:hypothetical protein